MSEKPPIDATEFFESLREEGRQQARVETARDIGEMLCCLAGNLMLEHKEEGLLLAEQLQPLMDWLKGRYVPDLPTKETVKEIINKQRQETAREIFEEIENRHFKIAGTTCVNYETGQCVPSQVPLNSHPWWQALKSRFLKEEK